MKQQTLEFEEPTNSSGKRFYLKSYIQPFERYLAHCELDALLGRRVSALSYKEADNSVIIPDEFDTDHFSNRLSYWESSGNFVVEPTLQVRLEASKEKEHIQNTDFSYHKSRKLRYGPHGIHEYRGKFFPQLVRALVNISGIEENSLVLDPMCGSGTTNCSARSIGMRTVGIDMNPLSVQIATTKTAILDINRTELEETAKKLKEDVLEAVILDLEKINIWSETDLDYLLRWFDKIALCEAAAIALLIKKIDDPNIRNLFETLLSNIIRTISWQKNKDLRVRKEEMPYTPGTAKTLFIEEIEKNLPKLLAYISNLEEFSPHPDFRIIQGDSRITNTYFSKGEDMFDLLITSPPYATALPYLDTDRLSLIFFNLLGRKGYKKKEKLMIGNREVSESERAKLWERYLEKSYLLTSEINNLINHIASYNHKKGVGFRRRNLPALLSKYFLDMYQVFESTRKVIKPGHSAFYVVGNNSTKLNGERFEIETDRLLWHLAEKAGWKQREMLNMELLPSRDIFSKNRGAAESILWLEA